MDEQLPVLIDHERYVHFQDELRPEAVLGNKAGVVRGACNLVSN